MAPCHQSPGFWKCLNDNYWVDSNKRNSKVEIDVIWHGGSKASVSGPNPRWEVVGTPGRRDIHGAGKVSDMEEQGLF